MRPGLAAEQEVWAMVWPRFLELVQSGAWTVSDLARDISFPDLRVSAGVLAAALATSRPPRARRVRQAIVYWTRCRERDLREVAQMVEQGATVRGALATLGASDPRRARLPYAFVQRWVASGFRDGSFRLAHAARAHYAFCAGRLRRAPRSRPLAASAPA